MSEEPSGSTPASAEDPDSLYNTAPFGDLSLGPDGRITKVNATLAAWVGLPAEALAGKRLRDLLTVPARIFYETSVAPVLKLQGRFEEVSLDLATPGVASCRCWPTLWKLGTPKAGCSRPASG